MFKKSTLKRFVRYGLLCLALCFIFGAFTVFADPVSDTGVVSEIFNVFELVGDWIVSQLSSLVVIFYSAETGLTFLGVLALVSLGISVIFLIMGVIQSFLKFRG